MTPKLWLAAVAALAIAVGFALPAPSREKHEPKSQIALQEIADS